MDSELQETVERHFSLRTWFIRYALLLPVVVMAGYYVGRGLGDSLQLLYVLCGVFTLKVMDFRMHRGVIYALILLLSIFLISVVYPEFAAKSLKYWILYALSGLVLLFTVGTFSQGAQASGYRLMVWVPVVLLVGFAVELGYFYFFANKFQPAIQVNGMVLAALAPLILLAAEYRDTPRRLLLSLFFGAAFLLLLAADSRTEVLMLITGGALFFAFARKKISTLFFLIPLAIVLSVVMDATVPFGNGLPGVADVYTWLDQLSSRRLSIWQEALSHAPDNYLTGVGVHRSMEFLGQLNVKHLHNMFIEIWYETGVLGLSAYLLLLFLLLRDLPGAYRTLQGVERRTYSVFFASGGAAMIGALLDKGYYHPLARYYLLFCFTVLYLFHRQDSRVKS